MSTEALASTQSPEDFDTGDVTAPADWRCTDLPSVDWALEKIADLERQRHENRELADAAKARVDAWEESKNKALEARAAWFRSRVLEFARNNRDGLLVGKRKSRDFPHGRVQFRAKGGGLVVTDEAALLAWAQSQPAELGLVRIKESPALKEIRAHCEPLGVVPPGCDWASETEEVVITATGGGLEKAEGK